MFKRAFAGVIAAVVVSPALAACGGESGPSITVYNAQHKQLIEEVAPLFEKETGVKVELRDGSDLELANQIVQEGGASPADVFLTENSPAMSLVDKAGLFTKVNPSTLSNIPAEYVPQDKNWMGFLARSTVLVYNKDKVKESELPTSLLDLAEPQWKDRVAFSPTGADFQAIVSAVVATEGEAKAKQWIDGLADNGKVLDNNLVVMRAVNSGEVDTGIIYHYYWYRDQKESGENSNDSALHFFGNQDPGAFVSVSGAGILKSSDNRENAQKFLAFLASVKGQQAIADSYALEYPLNPEVSLEPPVKPFDSLEPPKVDVGSLNSKTVIDLMQGAGLL